MNKTISSPQAIFCSACVWVCVFRAVSYVCFLRCFNSLSLSLPLRICLYRPNSLHNRFETFYSPLVQCSRSTTHQLVEIRYALSYTRFPFKQTLVACHMPAFMHISMQLHSQQVHCARARNPVLLNSWPVANGDRIWKEIIHKMWANWELTFWLVSIGMASSIRAFLRQRISIRLRSYAQPHEHNHYSFSVLYCIQLLQNGNTISPATITIFKLWLILNDIVHWIFSMWKICIIGMYIFKVFICECWWRGDALRKKKKIKKNIRNCPLFHEIASMRFVHWVYEGATQTYLFASRLFFFF